MLLKLLRPECCMITCCAEGPLVLELLAANSQRIRCPAFADWEGRPDQMAMADAMAREVTNCDDAIMPAQSAKADFASLLP